AMAPEVAWTAQERSARPEEAEGRDAGRARHVERARVEAHDEPRRGEQVPELLEAQLAGIGAIALRARDRGHQGFLARPGAPGYLEPAAAQGRRERGPARGIPEL